MRSSLEDAESLLRSKPIREIRLIETQTQKHIQSKQIELRQLIGNQYRDLIDSADSILLMKSSAQSISSNISLIHHKINSLTGSNTGYSSNSSPIKSDPVRTKPCPVWVKDYGVACRVKYLVDTPENIWGCLDESMFLEASGRYLRAKVVHGLVTGSGNNDNDKDLLKKFPLLKHQWGIVESFKGQISQRSRERLMENELEISGYADALAAVGVIDELEPRRVLGLFLESRKSWIMHKIGTCIVYDNAGNNVNVEFVINVLCDVMRVIQVTLGQIGEMFLQVVNDKPLFYKTILGSPPGSQLFGGLPNPDEEVRLWKVHRESLESEMLVLEKEYIVKVCTEWLRSCGGVIISKENKKYLIDVICRGEELSSAERLIKESLDSSKVLEKSLDWLKAVFGSEIEIDSPWNSIRGLLVDGDVDLWDGIFEESFVQRMKAIIDSRFEDLSRVVNVKESVRAVVASNGEEIAFQAYLSRVSTGGGVWFTDANGRKSVENDFDSSLNAYFGPEVSRIKDAVDSRCQSVLDDLLCFLDSQKLASRLKELAPYLQNKCYDSISAILGELEDEVECLSVSLGKRKEGNVDSELPNIIVERSLFIGRLLFALRNYSSCIPKILGSPMLWLKDTKNMTNVVGNLQSHIGNSIKSYDSLNIDSPRRHGLNSSKRKTSLGNAALSGVDDSPSPKLELVSRNARDLCIKAHNLWISWVSNELSVILSMHLESDDSLSVTVTTSLRGWEETEISKELKFELPSMPSIYIISFLFHACEEIHRVGGHVLDKVIFQKFALTLLERVMSVYGDFISTLEGRKPQVTDRGVLQILLDIRFIFDVLSGGNLNFNEELPRNARSKLAIKHAQGHNQLNSANKKVVVELLNNLSRKLDPIDWETYENFLWENEKQAYLRHAVLFGFFVQLNRMHTDIAQKLPSNSESNIMRCSTVPRFKYLPISAPILSSLGSAKSSLSTSSDKMSSNSSWAAYSTRELTQKLDFDDTSSFGAAAPLLKSFMQVGTRFGESTMKLSSILTDRQVSRFKDKSAAAMSTFGDMLPVQAAGILSSFTARSDI